MVAITEDGRLPGAIALHARMNARHLRMILEDLLAFLSLVLCHQEESLILCLDLADRIPVDAAWHRAVLATMPRAVAECLRLLSVHEFFPALVRLHVTVFRRAVHDVV